MKKILLCFTMLLAAGMAFGQQGLNCHPVFKGKVVPIERMVITEVRGGGMATYKLDYYKGLSFQVDPETAAKVADLVAADAKSAVACETEINGDFLTYALIQPKSNGKINRFLCYQARPTGESWVITLIYLEGIATREDLHSMFEKQK